MPQIVRLAIAVLALSSASFAQSLMLDGRCAWSDGSWREFVGELRGEPRDLAARLRPSHVELHGWQRECGEWPSFVRSNGSCASEALDAIVSVLREAELGELEAGFGTYWDAAVALEHNGRHADAERALALADREMGERDSTRMGEKLVSTRGRASFAFESGRWAEARELYANCKSWETCGCASAGEHAVWNEQAERCRLHLETIDELEESLIVGEENSSCLTCEHLLDAWRRGEGSRSLTAFLRRCTDERPDEFRVELSDESPRAEMVARFGNARGHLELLSWTGVESVLNLNELWNTPHAAEQLARMFECGKPVVDYLFARIDELERAAPYAAVKSAVIPLLERIPSGRARGEIIQLREDDDRAIRPFVELLSFTGLASAEPLVRRLSQDLNERSVLYEWEHPHALRVALERPR